MTDGECTSCDEPANAKTLSNLARRIQKEKIKMLMMGVGITYHQIKDFNIEEVVITDDFYELRDHGDLIQPDLLNRIALICDDV